MQQSHLFNDIQISSELIINSNNTNPCINNTIKFTFTLKDEYDNVLPNQEIIATINNNNYTLTTNSKGITTQTYTPTTAGTQTITAKFNGNSNYTSYETNITFNVKQNIIITYDAISDTRYGENITLSGKVRDVTGKGLGNVNTLIHINGVLFNVKTDNKGLFNFSTPAKTIGINNVTLSYGGNTYYNSYETNTTFNTTKQDIIITINPIQNTQYDDNITITGKFTNKNGKPITNSNINIYINNNHYQAKTNNNGTFKLVTPTNILGINNLTASYGANAYYNGFTTNTTFIVIAKD